MKGNALNPQKFENWLTVSPSPKANFNNFVIIKRMALKSYTDY